MAEAAPTETPKQTRRPRGEPRRLMLAAARDLFADQDYRSTTTKEIAEAAGVAEHLLFRNFGSKAALFREALVAPFVDLVMQFAERWQTFDYETEDEDAVGGDFIGSMYDVFVENRGLVMTLLASDSLDDEELEEAGIPEISDALAVLGRLGGEGIDIRGLQSSDTELSARSSVAMVAGMAAFGPTLFAGTVPSRDAIVEELTQMTLHGFLHRDG